MSDTLSVLAEAIKQCNIPPALQPYRISGKIERFTPAGDHQENGWYILYPVSDAVVGAFGCWKRGITKRFCSRERSTCTAAEWQIIQKAQGDAELARRAEEQSNHARVREECKALFSGKNKVTTHAYLEKKGVMAHGNLRVSNNSQTPGWLALPLIDATGTIHSAQFIAEDGTKRFFYQGRIQGCWFELATNPEGPICIVEGYATGASVHQATGWSTICAMNAGNLAAVSTAIRKLHPDRTIIIAADNDQWTEGNPGLTKAKLAAKPISATVICPHFADESIGEKPTDFNDLQRISGSGEVKRQIIEGTRTGGDWDLLIEDAADTMTEVIPEPIQLIEGLLCEEAKLVIGGSSKTYKTWITMDMGLSLSCGAIFIGRKCRKEKVLYVNFELKAKTFKKRIQTIVSAKGLKFSYQQFFHISLRGRISHMNPRQIVDKIIKMALARRCTVVVIDPIYKLNTQGKDENSAGEQTQFLNELDRITTEGKCSLIFDDHFSKGSQSNKDPLDAIRGSSAKGGDVDAAIIIRKHKEEGSFSVDVVHRELPPIEPFVITWQFPLFHQDGSLDAADMKQPRKGGRPPSVDPIEVLVGFKDTTPENGITVSRLAVNLGIARSTVRDYLPMLRSKSWIATVGEGARATQYLTKEGRERLGRG